MGSGFTLSKGGFRWDFWDEILPCDGDESLEWISQGSHGCSIPGNVPRPGWTRLGATWASGKGLEVADP